MKDAIINKYHNEHLRARVKDSVMLLPVIFWMLVAALFLMLLSVRGTWKDLYHGWPIDFDSLEGYSDIIYTVELEQTPKKLEGSYYIITQDGHPILARGLGEALYELRHTGHATIRGRVHRVPETSPEISLKAQAYYTKYGYYDSEKAQKVSMYYLDCETITFFSLMTDEHPLGLIFGITILIVAAIWIHTDGTLYVLRHIRPACGRTRYTPAEIDAQAEDPASIWIEDQGIIIAPDIIIGTQAGMTAVEYKDIAGLSIRTRTHTERVGPKRRHATYREYKTYDLVARTLSGKKLTLSKTGTSPRLVEAINERCGPKIWEE